MCDIARGVDLALVQAYELAHGFRKTDAKAASELAAAISVLASATSELAALASTSASFTVIDQRSSASSDDDNGDGLPGMPRNVKDVKVHYIESDRPNPFDSVAI